MDGPKQSLSSRLSTSTVSLFGKFSKGPPKPPPKDGWYLSNQLASKSSVSLAPSSSATSIALNTPIPSPYGNFIRNEQHLNNGSHETLQVPHAPPLAIRSHSDLSALSIPHTMSPVSARNVTPPSTEQRQTQQGGGFRRGLVQKLSNSLGKRTTIRPSQSPTHARRQGPISFFSRSNSSQATFDSSQTGPGGDDVGLYESPVGEEDVSRPWNVKHNLHVDEGLSNLPPEWMDKLRESGLRDTDIISVTSRRAHRTTYLKNHPDLFPDSAQSRTNSPFSPSTITSGSCFPSNNSNSSQSESPVDERVASPVSSSNHNHSMTNGIIASPVATHVNDTLPASALPARSTSLRRPMGSMTGPRSASMRKGSAPSHQASNHTSHAHTDSTGRTPSLTNSGSSTHSHSGSGHGASAADDAFSTAEEPERNAHTETDAEGLDDPNTATAAHFPIAAQASEGKLGARGNFGVGAATSGRRGGFLPRTEEEPEDQSPSNLRSEASYANANGYDYPEHPPPDVNGFPPRQRQRTNTGGSLGTLRVMNGSPPSPPPAYDSPPAGSPLEQYSQGLGDFKQEGARRDTRRSEETLTPGSLLLGQSDVQSPPSDGALRSESPTEQGEEEEGSAEYEEEEDLPIRSSALPPRLSFHGDDLGLGSWSASLFSTFDSEVDLPPSQLASSKPTSDTPPTQADTTEESATPSQTLEDSETTKPSMAPPQRKPTIVSPLVLTKHSKVPNVVIETDQDDDKQFGMPKSRRESDGSGSAPRTSTTPLFNEVLSLVQQKSPSSEGSQGSYTNSLNDGNLDTDREREIESPPLTSTYPYLPDPPMRSGSSSPLLSAALRSPSQRTDASLSPRLFSPHSPFPSPSMKSSDSHPRSNDSTSPGNRDYDFLQTSYDSQRGSSISQESDSNTISNRSPREDRWSRATTATVGTVRDVREATIVHGRKASVTLANAFPVPAPTRINSNPQLQGTPTSAAPSVARELSPARARELSAEGEDWRASYASTDSANSPEPSADDFPLPPPSPRSPTSSHINRVDPHRLSAHPSPISPSFSMHSRTSLAYMRPAVHTPGLHPPGSARGFGHAASSIPAVPQPVREKPLPSSPVRSLSHSSSGSNSGSLSSCSLRRDGAKTGSATSCEDETPEPGLPAISIVPTSARMQTPDAEKKRIGARPPPFRMDFSKTTGVKVFSPTESYISGTSSENWLNGEGADMVLDLEPIGIVPNSPAKSATLSPGMTRHRSRGSDGTSALMEWLEDAPSPRPMQSPALRDSVMMLGSSPKPQIVKADDNSAEKDALSSPKRPAIQTEGIKSPSLTTSAKVMQQQQQNFLSPASANTSRSPNSSNSNSSSSPSSAASSPLARYRGWVSEIVAPLEEFIDHDVEPRALFADMTEIAEGESGSVFSATLVALPRVKTSSRTRTPPPPSYALSFSSQRDGRKIGSKVAVKNVPLLPGGSPKLADLRKELMLMGRVRHENVLSMDALYVDLVEDALWIEMELMERSLADVLALGEFGLRLDESAIARFSGDLLNALQYLVEQGIVHRDLRSDNLLVNRQGVLKITDFSNALLVDNAYPTYNDAAGVIYWQAPEMRIGSYNALKVDVWSLGATAWEMAECAPPFMDLDVSEPKELPKRWPPLSNLERWSGLFVQFLEKCSRQERQRPDASELLQTPFIRKACPRSHIGPVQAP